MNISTDTVRDLYYDLSAMKDNDHLLLVCLLKWRRLGRGRGEGPISQRLSLQKESESMGVNGNIKLTTRDCSQKGTLQMSSVCNTSPSPEVYKDINDRFPTQFFPQICGRNGVFSIFFLTV